MTTKQTTGDPLTLTFLGADYLFAAGTDGAIHMLTGCGVPLCTISPAGGASVVTGAESDGGAASGDAGSGSGKDAAGKAAGGGGKLVPASADSSNKRLNGGGSAGASDADANTNWIWRLAARPRGSSQLAIGREDGSVAALRLVFSTVHSLHGDRYACRDTMADVVVQHLATGRRVRGGGRGRRRDGRGEV